MVKIAVDAMGGDKAPSEVIHGIRLFLQKDSETHVVLVGKTAEIEAELIKYHLKNHPQISIKHAEEVIDMGDSPVKALRAKKNTSMGVMMDLLKEKSVDAVMSAGNTGAMVACATLKLRTLEGIDKPGIATVMPTPYGKNILMDVGAVADCKPKNLVQFALMGSCIANLILGIFNPTIGLLNVGEEESKGNELAKDSFIELKKSSLNFYGNVEGRDVFQDTVNVIVTDGFVGNIVLKTSESLAKGLMSVIKKEFLGTFTGKIGALLLRNSFKRVKKQFDYEEYGGALLLGVKGVVIIAHGSSSPYAIMNAVRTGVKMVETKVNEEITKRIAKINV